MAATSPLPSNNQPRPWPITPDHDHSTWWDMTINACPTPFHDFPILTGLHGSVSWHLHCLCEVCWSFLDGYPCMGWEPTGFCKPPTRTCENPHSWMRVWVLTGTGVGYPRKPQGSPWHSLIAGGGRCGCVLGICNPSLTHTRDMGSWVLPVSLVGFETTCDSTTLHQPPTNDDHPPCHETGMTAHKQWVWDW